jgi:hypothetical protein
MRRVGVLFLLVLGFAASASAQGWSVFKSDRFGFAMLVAPGTQWQARDNGNGWGGIHATKGVLEFAGIVRLGYQATPRELEQFAVAVTKIPAKAWKRTDSGQNAAGWNWWKTFEAHNNSRNRVAFAVLGTGRKGSYILVLETDRNDFAAHRDLYNQWYRSLTLY